MSFMFRDRKDTEFDYFNTPSALNTKSDLECSRQVLQSLIEDCEKKIDSYKKDINIINFALQNKFYSSEV